MGIPAVGIMTDRFQRSAQLMAELNGLPGYPFAVIDHPIANNSDDLLRQKAEIAVARIIPLLTEREG
jgi:hypothetical protein